MRIGLVRRVGFVIYRAHAAHQAGGVMEHIFGISHCGCVPALTHNDGLQTGAAIEHVTHIGYLGRVETVQVKTCQGSAAIEHATHIGYLGRVETVQVKTCQLCTISKHFTHIGHLAGVQVSHARDRLKILHIVKPSMGGRRAVISERAVKDCLGRRKKRQRPQG